MKSATWVRAMLRDLKRSGVAFEVQAAKKHYQLFIEGELVVTISQGSNVKATTAKNCEARVKRAVREALERKNGRREKGEE